MKLYLISQDINVEYDTYDSAVVCSENAKNARMLHPNGFPWNGKAGAYDTWASAEDIKVEEIGEANPDILPGAILCASFNAG